MAMCSHCSTVPCTSHPVNYDFERFRVLSSHHPSCHNRGHYLTRTRFDKTTLGPRLPSKCRFVTKYGLLDA
eukprot:6320718-Pyramimonas_sp.AAC.2